VCFVIDVMSRMMTATKYAWNNSHVNEVKKKIGCELCKEIKIEAEGQCHHCERSIGKCCLKQCEDCMETYCADCATLK